MYCKFSSKNSGLLHILCIYRSPNSKIENNNNLNSLISKFSKLNGHLLILGNINYPTINWAMLVTPHIKENWTTKFLTVTKNSFLHLHVNNTIHVRPNQTPTLIDLIFTSDDQTINNLSFLSPLGKSQHNVITFHYQLEYIKLSKAGCNYHKANYTAMKRKLSDSEWQGLFQGKDVDLSWETFLKLLNDIILKFTARRPFNNKRKKIYQDEQSSLFESSVEKRNTSIFTR